MYDDLKAPFDFAILKSDTELQQETEIFDAEFSPYYKREPKKTEEGLNRFDQLFAKKIIDSGYDSTFIEVIENQDNYKQFGRTVLTNLYKKGVIDLVPEHQNRGNLFKVRVTYKNTVETPAQNFYNNRKATEFIIDTLPQSGLAMPGFLTGPLQESLIPKKRQNHAFARYGTTGRRDCVQRQHHHRRNQPATTFTQKCLRAKHHQKKKVRFGCCLVTSY